MLEANRLILDNLVAQRRGRADRLAASTGAWWSSRAPAWSARTVRGPAVIGAGAQLRDCYVGPYTAIGEGCTIAGAEVEHSILLAGSSVCDLDGRMESSLLGRNVTRPPRRPPAAGLPLHGRRQLRHLDPVRAAASPAPPGCSAATCARPRERAGHELLALDLPSSTSPTRRAVALVRAAPSAPDGGHQLRRLDRRRRRRDPARAGPRGQRRGRRQPRRAAAASAASRCCTSPPTTSSTGRRRATPTGARAPYVESDPTGPRSVYGRSKLAGERQVLGGLPAPRGRAHRLAVRRATGATSSTTMLRLAGEREAVQVVDDQVGSPTWTGHLAPALLGLLEREVAGSSTSPAPAPSPGTASRRRSSARPRSTAGWSRSTSAQMARPAPRPAWSVLASRARRRAADARLARRPRRLSRGASWDDARMKLLVCGGAGFIGSTLRARAPARARRRGDGARQAHLRRARGEPPATSPSDPASASCTARSRTREAVRGARSLDGRGRRRSSTSPPRRTSTARSPSPTRSCARTRSAPTCCSRRRASAACATCRSPPTRSTARSRRAPSPSPRRCGPPRRTRRPRPAPTCSCRATSTPTACRRAICRGSNNYGPYQYPEKLIPLMILNALHGDRAAGLRRRQAGAQLDPRDRLRARDRPRARARAPGRGLQRRRPRRAAEHRGRQADPRAHRRRRVADRARHRPARPRPALLALLRRRCARSAGSRACASRRASSRPSPGTARTPGGGSRSAPASTAPTTSASTGAHSAEIGPQRGRSQTKRFSANAEKNVYSRSSSRR